MEEEELIKFRAGRGEVVWSPGEGKGKESVDEVLAFWHSGILAWWEKGFHLTTTPPLTPLFWG